MDRRRFINTSVAAGAAVMGMTTGAQAAEPKPLSILGIACSPRQGKTTATSLQVALDAAAEVHANIKIDLIDLGGLTFSGWNGSGKFAEDDFTGVIMPKLKDPDLGALIIGSPVYFRNKSSLCMAFLERLGALRKPKLLLADKVVGALSVGAYRNGGQELVIQQIQAGMLCHEVVLVGGKPGAHQGATLWNAYKDDITKDEFGMATARQLGTRVAEAVLAGA